jgi:hypothetical protein
MFRLNNDDDVPMDVKSLIISFDPDSHDDRFSIGICYNKEFATHTHWLRTKELTISYGYTSTYVPSDYDVVNLISSATHLKKLKILSLPVNDVQERLFHLKHLKSLTLWKTGVSVLSPTICLLTTLERLDLTENNLDELPPFIGNLYNLTHLCVKDNKLIRLPESIYGLETLKTLDVTGNKLTSLPESITQLTKLKKLMADNNQLTRLPLCIGTMTNLKVMSIVGNKITTLPESIAYNKKLRYKLVKHRSYIWEDVECCCMKNKYAKKRSRIPHYIAKKRIFIRTYFVLALKCPASVTTAVIHFTGLDTNGNSVRDYL